jgi:hypothetical protein
LDKTLDNEKLETTQLPDDEAGGAVPPGETPVDAAETQMRRALGLVGDGPIGHAPQPEPAMRLSLRTHPSEGMRPGRPARRFVRDGEVPVTVIRGPRAQASGADQPVTNRVAVAEAAADAERLKRERTERSLRDSLDTIRDLQTKQAHIELARDEALQALKRSAEMVESLHAALQSHQEQLAVMQAAVQAGERAVRAGRAVLSAGLSAERRAERSARAAAETAAKDAAETAAKDAARARRAPKKIAVRAARRSPAAAVRKRAAGSSARKANAKPLRKNARPVKPARKGAVSSRKSKLARSAAPKKSVTAVRKSARRVAKRRS